MKCRSKRQYEEESREELCLNHSHSYDIYRIVTSSSPKALGSKLSDETYVTSIPKEL